MPDIIKGNDDTPETHNVQIRTLLKLSEVERLIKKYRIMMPCPSRQTLIRMCEDGTFETPGYRRRWVWTVYADSFWRWAGGENKTQTEKI
jgi:hypothetical protein